MWKHLRAITWMALDLMGLDGPTRWWVFPWNQTFSLLRQQPVEGAGLTDGSKKRLVLAGQENEWNVFPLDRINCGFLCRGAVNVVKVRTIPRALA